ncbi:MAG: DUF3383 family protein [Patescibacteria group bacterium]|nr:DUF3383 family protein [Patescibacteria group bacterium]
MAISIKNFVDITSAVGGANQVPTRNYGLMIITKNTLCPTGVVKTFTSASDVGTFFGTTSEEYYRAEFYFGWVSKVATSPQLLSFWNWNNDTATADYIYGAMGPYSLSTFTAITAGQLDLTMGGVTHTLTGIDLSGAADLAGVAADLQTAIRAYVSGGTPWTSATVTYDATGSGRFNLVSGSTGVDTIAVVAAASNDIAGPLGWLSSSAILSNGTNAQTISDNLIQLVDLSNNFGSICTTFDLALTLTNTEAIANWNNSLTPNIQFIYTVNVTPSNASSWSTALLNIGGTCLTLASPGSAATTEYPEMIPSMIFAATDYNAVNSVQNYKYQEFALTPSVTTDADYNTYTALRVNFYGSTQTAGQIISFYMEGFMMGLSANPGYMNLYANEIWFKDNLAAGLLNLLLALTQIPANLTGVGLITASLQSVINTALNNGTISVGKTLTSTQQLYIGQVTGNSTAWRQVQNTGYWLNVVIESSVVAGVTTYTAVYTLVYSKDDVVQSITGSNILI